MRTLPTGDENRPPRAWDLWNTPVLPPEAGEIRLYYAGRDAMDDETKQAFDSWLDETEQARRDRFLPPETRALFSAAHGLVRHCLSLWLRDSGVKPPNPKAWRFEVDHLGKPVAVLPGAAEIAIPLFSLSHTRGGAAVALGNTLRLGADIENQNRAVADLAIAERYFTDEERDDIFRQDSEEKRRQRFILFWTLKEAYLKALGLGLTKPLSSFAFAPGRTDARLLYDRENTETGWSFRHFRTGDGVIGSVAAQSPNGPIRLRRFELDTGKGWMQVEEDSLPSRSSIPNAETCEAVKEALSEEGSPMTMANLRKMWNKA